MNTASNVIYLASMAMSQDHHQILVVEDDPAIAGLVAGALKRAGYGVSIAADVKKARFLLTEEPPDLIVLDLMLPGESGLDLARSLVDKPRTPPIIMLTALTELSNRLAGFAAGADDYINKPFSSEELIARIEAVLRRAAHPPAVAPHIALVFEGWKMNIRGRTLTTPDHVEIVLTSAEFDVLATLCMSAGKVLSRDQIVLKSQGRRVEPYDRSVDTLISRLRQKIEADPAMPMMIKTVRNGGYVFTPAVTQVSE
ncbi:MAG: response regulator transcription factor [Roseicyclus sp.]|nr:response regulator transcription factor [Roseicyclus sp.]MBO6626735.1 response regulator transcription factor [Roseicyclus sp.]